MGGLLYFAAKVLGHQLHPVANPEDRNARIPNFWIGARGIGLIDAGGPTGENKAFGLALLNLFQRSAKWENFAIDFGLAHPSRNELSVLRTEVENDNHRSR